MILTAEQIFRLANYSRQQHCIFEILITIWYKYSRVVMNKWIQEGSPALKPSLQKGAVIILVLIYLIFIYLFNV